MEAWASTLSEQEALFTPIPIPIPIPSPFQRTIELFNRQIDHQRMASEVWRRSIGWSSIATRHSVLISIPFCLLSQW